MHALVIAAFAVSTAVAQVPEGSTPPPPPPPVSAPAPAPAAGAPVGTYAERNAANIAAEGDGRWALIGVSTTAGLGYYGWSIPAALNMQFNTQAVGVYMLTGAASFFVPFALTLNTPVTWGQTNLFYGGATHGPAHASLMLVLANVQLSSFQQFALANLVGGALEIGGGMAWATLGALTAGTAHAIIVTSDVGAGVGAAIASIIGASVTLTSGQLPAGLALVGAAGGAYAGSVLGPMLHLTWGDAELLWISTLLGAYVPIPFVYWTDARDIRAYTSLALLGAAGGAAAGYYLLQDLHLELGQALLIDLGMVAGGLVGLGTALVLGGTDNTNFTKIALTSSMVGAVGGYAISYVAMKGQATPKKMGANVQVTFNPTALTDLMAPKAPGASTAARPRQPPPPALALVGSF